MPDKDGKLTPQEIAESLLDPKAFDEKQKQKLELAKKAAKAEEEKKKKGKAAAPKPLAYYDVKIEVMLPAVLHYKVLAEDAFKAAEMIKNKPPNSVTYKLIGVKNLILRVYDAGTTMLRHMRRF